MSIEYQGAAHNTMDAGLRQTSAEYHRKGDIQVTDHLLRRDIRTLGFELSRMIRRHAGEEPYQRFELLRDLAKQRRSTPTESENSLRHHIAQLSTEQLGEVIRAVTCFFDLANLAEDRHRIRVLRDRERRIHPAPRTESVGDAIIQLRERGFSAGQVRELLHHLCVELVFTAHPTEAKRRTVRNSLRRLRHDLIAIDRRNLIPRERDRIITDIHTNLACLWETDPLRPNKPTVLEEVERSLFVIDSLWEVMPWLFRSVQAGFEQAFAGETLELQGLVRFGTWIGGDRDGNPFVTADVTESALTTLRETALNMHLEQARQVSEVLSIATTYHPITDELEARINEAVDSWDEIRLQAQTRHPREKYRLWLRVIRYRLTKTLRPDPSDVGGHRASYASAMQLLDDLQLIVNSLRAAGHDELAEGPLWDWIVRTRVFGFHIARMDIREHSGKLHDAVAELIRQAELGPDYLELDEDARIELLTQAISIEQARRIDIDKLSESTAETFKLFLLLEREARTYGLEPLGAAIISMTHHVSDVLTMRFLSQLAARFEGQDTVAAKMPIVPLLETIDDLERGGHILETLLSHPIYRQHVRDTGDEQICMVGYSDSCKDGGFLASNWNLFTAQEVLAEAVAAYDVKLTVFHGRGGALGRGGGPAARGIMSLPSSSNLGSIRITEQGEVLANRYDDPEIALRHLEQVSYATLLKCAAIDPPVPAIWRRAMDTASHEAFNAYRTLRDDTSFMDYFSHATPIDIIETMPIGSRPSRRRGGKRELEDLRAIPYTFAWTQSRHMLTAFYGIGSGLQAVEDWDLLRQMYKHWPFFHAVIHNAELALVKADMDVARQYAMLPEDQQAGNRLWEMINEEYERSRTAVLKIINHDELLSGAGWLARSVNARNPYVDILNFAQIELLSRRSEILRETVNPHEQNHVLSLLEQQLRLSVQGIAAGVRTTG